MTTKILDKDNPILRAHSKDVAIKDIKSKAIQSVIKNMKDALNEQDDGVAIAAPQIGENLNIFIVSKKAFELIKGNKKNIILEDMVFINPQIIKFSKKRKAMEEGCLSVRWLYGKVERSEKVHIRAYDESGDIIERGSTGLLAQIFQHEIDHLNGILFIDKAKDLEEIPPVNTKSN
ncbi:MAG: peptide deformylase [bacterium]|nr:peptide deformylase [bacterium]